MAVFVASRWSGDDNAVFPDRLEIERTCVTYFKGTVVGYRKSIIPRERIASVHMRSGLLFANIIIESFGGREIVARGFSKSDARRVVELLEPTF
jgi:hypothetical protein